MTNPEAVYDGNPDDAETLAIERRLLARGYGELPALLRGDGDFAFGGDTIEEVLQEASRYLEHQYAVDLIGARVLAALGESAVKAQAFDAIVEIVRRQAS
jgi:hypothetical protein